MAENTSKVVTDGVFKRTIQMILTIIKNRRIPTTQLQETANLKVLTSGERSKISTITTNGDGSHFLANNGIYRAVSLSDFAETANRKFMTSAERNKVSKLVINGDGNSYLANDGEYRKINADNIVNGTTNKVFTETEKNKVSRLITTGDGNSYLANDGTYGKINADNIVNGNANKVYTSSEKEKVSKLVTTGIGTKVLADDGTYKVPDSVGVVNDNVVVDDMAYSSKKIEEKFSELNDDITNRLLGKSNIDHTHTELASSHAHSNKDVLDQIDDVLYGKMERLLRIIDPDKSGIGTKVFYDDYTFKEVEMPDDSSGSASACPFDEVDWNDFVIKDVVIDEETEQTTRELSLHYPIVLLTNQEYKLLANSSSIKSNTIYITTDDDKISM